jgi:hypothetical protein
MPSFVQTTKVVMVAAIAALGTPAQSMAHEPASNSERLDLARQGRWAEIKVLENEDRMRQHQRDHRQFMEQLREIAPPKRPEIPRMQRSCSTPVHGNAWLPAGCR